MRSRCCSLGSLLDAIDADSTSAARLRSGAVEYVRQLRGDARGDRMAAAPPDATRESRAALLAWSEHQLYAAESAEQRTIAAFHDQAFPHIMGTGNPKPVAPSVQKFMAEMSDRLLDWVDKGESPDGSVLPEIGLLGSQDRELVVERAVEAAVTPPIAEPLLSAVKATQREQDKQAGRVLAQLRGMAPELLATKLGLSERLLATATERSYPDAAWTEAAGVLSAVGRVATPAAKMRGLQATIFAIQHELSRPPSAAGAAEPGVVEQAEAPMLGAGELLPIVQWVMVHSNLVGVGATLTYLEQLLFRSDPDVSTPPGLA